MFKRIKLLIILIVVSFLFFKSESLIEVIFGIAIFLFGMRLMQSGFKNFTGGTFERILQKSTDKTWKGILFGAVAAAIMQSSSIIGIITIGFLSAGLINLMQGIAITIGSNIGTTAGPWIVAILSGGKVNIGLLGMPFAIIGIFSAYSKNKTVKGVGNILLGLGFIFIGTQELKDGFDALKSSLECIEANGCLTPNQLQIWFSKIKEIVPSINGFRGVLLFTGLGLIITIITQSSFGTIVIIISMLSNGLMYENAFAMVIGANIGTNFTSFLVSFTGNKDGKRVGLNDLILKIVAALTFIIFFNKILLITNFIANIVGIGSDNYIMKLALYHTLFNITGVSIMLIFMTKIVKLLKKVFPDERLNVYGNIYLNKQTSFLPDTAIISLIKEVRHLYLNVTEVVLKIFGLKRNILSENINFEELKLDVVDIEEIDNLYDKEVKTLYGEIIDYTLNAQSVNEDKYSNDFQKIKLASIYLAEVVKGVKHIQKNLSIYLKSTNLDTKTQYQKIIIDLLTIISKIDKLSKARNENAKLLIYADIRKCIEENDMINNGTIDRLIREDKISNEMATSLINDSSYKNEIFKDLLASSEIMFGNNILNNTTKLSDKKEENWLPKEVGMTHKLLNKIIYKLEKKAKKVKSQMKEEKLGKKKERLKEKLEDINFVINKYKS